jgi:RecB family exonuclease
MRFHLRYVQRAVWPALQAEPAREHERHIQRGERFHRLAQQYLLGVPEDRLARMAAADEDALLVQWWENFLACIPAELEGRRCVEAAFETPLGGFRLAAKYDLVLIRPDGHVTIFDWKTGGRRPERARLLRRLQTRVYPYVLVQAGAHLNQGRPIDPAQVEMVYWFSAPDQPAEHIRYSAEQNSQDEHYLLDLAQTIAGMAAEAFRTCADEGPCRFCVYRSLCRRGERAGALEAALQLEDAFALEPDDLAGLSFGLEQVGEISF